MLIPLVFGGGGSLLGCSLPSIDMSAPCFVLDNKTFGAYLVVAVLRVSSFIIEVLNFLPSSGALFITSAETARTSEWDQGCFGAMRYLLLTGPLAEYQSGKEDFPGDGALARLLARDFALVKQ